MLNSSPTTYTIKLGVRVSLNNVVHYAIAMFATYKLNIVLFMNRLNLMLVVDNITIQCKHILH